jgi:hypothetical protein
MYNENLKLILIGVLWCVLCVNAHEIKHAARGLNVKRSHEKNVRNIEERFVSEGNHNEIHASQRHFVNLSKSQNVVLDNRFRTAVCEDGSAVSEIILKHKHESISEHLIDTPMAEIFFTCHTFHHGVTEGSYHHYWEDYSTGYSKSEGMHCSQGTYVSGMSCVERLKTRFDEQDRQWFECPLNKKGVYNTKTDISEGAIKIRCTHFIPSHSSGHRRLAEDNVEEKVARYERPKDETTLIIVSSVIASVIFLTYCALFFAEKKEREMQLYSLYVFFEGVARFIVFVAAVVMAAASFVEISEYYNWAESLIKGNSTVVVLNDVESNNIIYAFFVFVNVIQGLASVIVAWSTIFDIRSQTERSIHNHFVAVVRVPILTFFGCCMLLSGAVNQQRTFNLLNTNGFNSVFNELVGVFDFNAQGTVTAEEENQRLQVFIIVLKAILLFGGIICIFGGMLYEYYYPGSTKVAYTFEDEQRAIEDGWYPPHRWYLQDGKVRQTDNERFKPYALFMTKDGKRSKPIFRKMQIYSYIPMIVWTMLISALAGYARSEQKDALEWSIYNEYFHLFFNIVLICIILLANIVNVARDFENSVLHSSVIFATYIVFSWGILNSEILEIYDAFPDYYIHTKEWNPYFQLILALLPLMNYFVFNPPLNFIQRIYEEVNDFTAWVAVHMGKIIYTPLERHPIRPLVLMCGIASVIILLLSVQLPMYDIQIKEGTVISEIKEKFDEVGDVADKILDSMAKVARGFDPCFRGYKTTYTCPEGYVESLNDGTANSNTECRIENNIPSETEGITGLNSGIQNSATKKIWNDPAKSEQCKTQNDFDGCMRQKNAKEISRSNLHDPETCSAITDEVEKRTCTQNTEKDDDHRLPDDDFVDPADDKLGVEKIAIKVPQIDQKCRDIMCYMFLGILSALLILAMIPFANISAVPLRILQGIAKGLWELGKFFIRLIKWMLPKRRTLRRIRNVFMKIASEFTAYTSGKIPSAVKFQGQMYLALIPLFIIAIICIFIAFWKRKPAKEAMTLRPDIEATENTNDTQKTTSQKKVKVIYEPISKMFTAFMFALVFGSTIVSFAIALGFVNMIDIMTKILGSLPKDILDLSITRELGLRYFYIASFLGFVAGSWLTMEIGAQYFNIYDTTNIIHKKNKTRSASVVPLGTLYRRNNEEQRLLRNISDNALIAQNKDSQQASQNGTNDIKKRRLKRKPLNIFSNTFKNALKPATSSDGKPLPKQQRMGAWLLLLFILISPLVAIIQQGPWSSHPGHLFHITNRKSQLAEEASASASAVQTFNFAITETNMDTSGNACDIIGKFIMMIAKIAIKALLNVITDIMRITFERLSILISNFVDQINPCNMDNDGIQTLCDFASLMSIRLESAIIFVPSAMISIIIVIGTIFSPVLSDNTLNSLIILCLPLAVFGFEIMISVLGLLSIVNGINIPFTKFELVWGEGAIAGLVVYIFIFVILFVHLINQYWIMEDNSKIILSKT